MGGWTVVGKAPDIHKAVFIVAPHTSNWDGFWALVCVVALRLDVHFFGKKSLFWFPLSVLLKGLGGIPLDRSAAHSAVQQAIDAFDSAHRFNFALAPEGTRSKTVGWKTGFYRIAEGAGVPVFLAFIDYRGKRLGIGPMLTLTGDMRADLEICRFFYDARRGYRPAKASPVTPQSPGTS